MGMSRILSMPSFPTGDPEAPATQAMEVLPSSLVEQNHLAQTHLAQEQRLTAKDLALGLAASVTFLNAAGKHSQLILSSSPFASFCPKIMTRWCR